MFIAHLPAGYLLSRQLSKRHEYQKALIVTGLITSILPDGDLLWFYLIDHRQTAHHSYVFHWPLFWIGLAVVTSAVAYILQCWRTFPFIGIALASLMLHMILDSVAAEIGWLKPFSDYTINMFVVTARYDWWVWNFILHWTFLFEIGIVLAAIFTIWRDASHLELQ